MILRLSRGSALAAVAFVVALLVAPSTRAETMEPRAWEALGPAEKPVSRLFTPTSGALFAATDGQLFRSDDGGLIWATEFQPHGINSARLTTIEGCTVRGDPVPRMSYDEGRTSALFPEVNMLDWSSNALVGGQGASPDR
jgi:hypothetical protein